MKRTFGIMLSILMLLTVFMSGCQSSEVTAGGDSPIHIPEQTTSAMPSDESKTDAPADIQSAQTQTQSAAPEETAKSETIKNYEDSKAVETKIDLTRDDLFFFSNYLEGNRVYCQNKDGGELTLVVDMHAYDVKKAGTSVFFQSGSDLYEFDLETSELKKIVEDKVYYYDAGENYVFYSTYGWDEAAGLEYAKLYAIDRNSGEEVSTDIVSVNELYAYGDSVYYANPTNDYMSFSLVKWTPAEDYHQLIADNLSYDAITFGDGAVRFMENGTNTVYDCESGEKKTIGISNQEMANIYYTDGSYILTSMDSLWKADFITVYKDQRPMGSVRIENAQIVDVLDRIDDTLFIRAWISYTRPDENYYYDDVSFYKYYTYDLADNVLKEVTTPGVNGSLFADGSFPIVDSSTARQPITNSLYNLFVTGYDFKGDKPLCSKTHGAWTNMAEGTIDLALLASPTDEEQAYLDKNGVTVEMKQYGSDGLVFMGNTENLAKALTLDDIRAIYKGEITNWKELGGSDEEIVVYYRNDQSGSQRLFEKLVFPDGFIPDYAALGFEIFDEMSGIVDEVANEKGAIGYSLLTYVDVVYEHEEVKLFAVDDVEPTIDNIAKGDYPLATAGYVVINADEPKDSPARRLYDWFGCELSKQFIRECGVVPTFTE